VQKIAMGFESRLPFGGVFDLRGENHFRHPDLLWWV
jgi:hypothetical protein